MSFPRKVQAVVFDMDGLLVDTEIVVLRAMQRASAAVGGELPDHVFRRMIGLANAASEAIVVEHFGAGFDIASWSADVSKHFREELAAGIALKTGAVEILDLLDRMGLPRAIATSSTLNAVNASLGPHGLVERFDVLITRDVQDHHKPHPDPFLKAARALGVEAADCLALEDSHNGVRAASSAGMMTVMVPDMLDPTEEMRSLTVRIATDLHEVRELLAAQA